MTFPTWQKPGSACYHDVSMGHISVKDQYCNAETGNWHETVFMGTTDCSRRWWNRDDGFDVTITTDGCVGGYRLAACHSGPCREEAEEDEEIVENLIAINFLPIDEPSARG